MAKGSRNHRNAAHRARMDKKKAERAAAAAKPKSTTAKLLTLWRQASLMQKRGVILAAIVIAGSAVTFAIKTARLPNAKPNAKQLEYCLRSTSMLPFKTDIITGIGQKGNPLTDDQQLQLIEDGLNGQLEEVKAGDTGAIIDRASGRPIGQYQGVASYVVSDKPINNLPKTYSMTIGTRTIDDINESDRFVVTKQGITLGNNAFTFNEVVDTIKLDANSSAYLIPRGRVVYNVRGKSPEYACR